MTAQIVSPEVTWNRRHAPVQWTWWQLLLRPFTVVVEFFLKDWLSKILGNLILKVRRPDIAYKHHMAGLEKGVEPSHEEVDAYLRNSAQQLGIENLFIEHIAVKVDEQTTLDTIQLSLKPADQCKKATLVLTGNTVRMEHNYALDSLLSEFKCADKPFDEDRIVVGFNYRGVGKSTGFCRYFSMLIEDARFQAARLLGQMKINAPDLIIQAHSLGAMVGTTVAAELHAHDKNVRFTNDRSGSCFADIVVGYVWERIDRAGYPNLGRFIGELCRPVIDLVIKMGGWEIDVTTPFLEIAADHTFISTLRSNKADRQRYPRGDDRNIIHDASLYRSIKHKVPKGLQYSRHQCKKLIEELKASGAISEDESTEMREILRTYKCYGAEPPKESGNSGGRSSRDPRNRDAHARHMEKLTTRNQHAGNPKVHAAYLAFRDSPPDHPQMVCEKRLRPHLVRA